MTKIELENTQHSVLSLLYANGSEQCNKENQIFRNVNHGRSPRLYTVFAQCHQIRPIMTICPYNLLFFGGATRGVMAIVAENGHGDPSSNPRRVC